MAHRLLRACTDRSLASRSPLITFTSLRTAPVWILSIVLVFTLWPRVIHAADPTQNVTGKPQAVGLVLSGGGAKGIAHIGVIQALEDNDIPIDYVTGTSMGAIVGGLYAAGYTPAEMLELIQSKGFRYWSSGRIDPAFVYYWAREQPKPKLVTFNLNFADSSQIDNILPTSLISPLPMNYAFMELFARYSAQCDGDFNRLFVPFRCVASDVYNKHKVVLRSGSLGDAIRASMTFPLVFEPIMIDSVLLYDGGIYDNFPVDVMREDFSPDIMLGIDVSAPDKKPTRNSLIDQVSDMVIQNNDLSLPADEGIKIHVPVQQYGLLDWTSAKAIYDIGYNTAMDMMDSIKERVTARIPSETRTLRRNVFKSSTPYVVFDSVHASGASPRQNEYIRYLFTQSRRDTFGLRQARDVYYRAISGGKFRNLVPRAIFDDSTGMFTLDLNADVKTDFNVGFGGYITSATNSMVFLSGGYRTLSFNSLSAEVNGWIGQTYMAGSVNMSAALRTPNPSRIVFEGVISREKMLDNTHIFYDEGVTINTASELFARLHYDAAAGRNAKVDFSIGAGRISNRFFSGLLVTLHDRDRLTLTLGQARLMYERNTLDDETYPTSGSRMRAMIYGVYGNSDFYPNGVKADKTHDNGRHWITATVKYDKYIRLGQSMRLGLETTGVFTSMPNMGTYAATSVMLPAFHPTPSSYSYYSEHFRAPQYVTAGLLPVWNPNGGALQFRGNFHVMYPLRQIVPTAIPTLEASRVGVDRTRWFGHHPEYFAEIAAVYRLPFAQVSGYVNYATNAGKPWNLGISFGLFFLAPRFM